MEFANVSGKQAVTEFALNPLIANRWSPRAFSNKIPEREQVLKLLDAARWAASSFNEQPWRFIVGIKDEADSYNKILECLDSFNQEWAKNAPVLMLVCSKKTFTKTGKNNRHYMYDSGAAMANLCIQAIADDLYVHQMAGINPGKAVDIFGVPEDYEVLTGVAVGYLGDPDILSEKNQKSERAERHRKDLSEISFMGEWGNSL